MLTIAKEVSSKHPLPLLDINYRRRQLAFRRSQISQWLTNEQEQLREEAESSKAQGQPLDEEYIATRVSNMEKEASRQESDALGMYGMLEGNDPSIAPLRRALAVWGLTADDIGVLSIHGTSTKANVCFFTFYPHEHFSEISQEENETHIWNTVLQNLGRNAGNAVPIMAQKSLLGHAKGGAAAWQMSGVLDTINTGVVPGNRNSEYVCKVHQVNVF